MPEQNEPFDQSFYTLSYLGCVILAGGLLDSEVGREKIRHIFLQGLLAAGSFENAMQIPEFRKAVADYEATGAPVDAPEGSSIPEVR